MAGNEKLSASLEDYLEAIFNLSNETGSARSRDMAKLLSVSKASVTGALRMLGKRGLVNYEPYGFVSLTKAGQIKAAAVAKKHDVIKSFFVDVLGVDEESAADAACKAEHTLGKPIIGKLMSFIEFVMQERQNGNDLVSDFYKFHKQKEKSVPELAPAENKRNLNKIQNL